MLPAVIIPAELRDLVITAIAAAIVKDIQGEQRAQEFAAAAVAASDDAPAAAAPPLEHRARRPRAPNSVAPHHSTSGELDSQGWGSSGARLLAHGDTRDGGTHKITPTAARRKGAA